MSIFRCLTLGLMSLPSLETAGLTHPVAWCHIWWHGVTSCGAMSHPVAWCLIRWHSVTYGSKVSHPVAQFHIRWHSVASRGTVSHPVARCRVRWHGVTSQKSYLLCNTAVTTCSLLPFFISLLCFPTPYQECTKQQNKECLMSVE
jgi:hypothetical protein